MPSFGRRIPLIALAALISCAGNSTRPPETGTLAIRAGRVLDVRSGQITEGVVLLVRRGIIVAAGRNVGIPAGVPVVDATKYTLLPGLIDAHVHLTIQGDPRANARKTLEAGFTTVADLGSAGGAGVRLKRAIDGDSTPGPRMVVAGSWIGGRGGVCEFGGATIRGDSEAAARAESDVRAGAELLKVCVTDWLDPAVQFPDSVELTPGELAAVARVGARARLPLVAHAIGRAGVAASLAAGVRLFAHTPVVDDDGAAELARSGSCVATTTTTLLRGESAAALRTSFQRLRRARVRMMLGTDAGVLLHGTNAEELVTLVSLGLTPLEAIGTATWGAADCLKLPHYGLLSVGSSADIVGVAGNPLNDIGLLKTPSFVMKAGSMVMRKD